tara:strand:- start:14665 stop:15042 length:378 start_codon:yes stop_codon:yes gene_type:complete
VKTLAISLALFLFLKPVLPVVEYVVFYDYINEVLCINKEKIAMKCNGKCFLKQQLAKSSEASENSKKSDGRKVSFENTIVFYQEIKSTNFYNLFLFDKPSAQNHYYINLYNHTFVASIFHPPLTV